jgi:DNA helicase-2/ATP-dependent DNA helicase PcrA
MPTMRWSCAQRLRAPVHSRLLTAALNLTNTASLLEQLNPAQRNAVEAPDGPLLIFAGAGSGKTRVLTHRIAHVIATRDVRPQEICAVTFTNKAAREMRARVEQLIGESIKGMWLGTFHAMGARMLRRDGDAIGIPSTFTIYDEADRMSAMRRAIRTEGVDDKRYPPSRVGHAISRAKNELYDARMYESSAATPFEKEAARVFWSYEQELDNASALDFDDLLLRPVVLLREVDAVRDYYQERFRHLFVDEYQDTNHAQYEMVKLLSAKHRNVTVVGDDDQSIYGFRGSDVRNILAFERDYPDARVMTLEQNYRSTQSILDTAHAVIKHNPERAPKKLWTELAGGEPVRLISVYDEQEEAMAVCSEIESLVGRESVSLSDCAVLYRTNAQSRAFEDVFLRRGIPYRLVGGLRFYERREIKDVLAYLRLAANERDTVSFARVVNVPKRKIGDRTVAELEKLARKKGLSPMEAARRIDESEGLGPGAMQALGDFAKLMGELGARARRVPLPVLVEEVLEETGYGRLLQDGSPEGMERWANVTELIGLAGEYADVPAPDGLFQFLENVALVSDVDTLDDSAQGVTLITLHQVKGLEFEVVFIAGLEEGLLPHSRSLEDGEAGIAEERRLAYVGITRARRHLYLLHAFRRHLYGTPQLAEASRFLGEIPAELMEVAQRPGQMRIDNVRAPGTVRRAVHAHAVRPNPVELAPQRYGAGMRIAHQKYGEGTVLKSTMTRSGEELVIKFDDHGMKIFAVGDATLWPVET